MVSRLVAAGEGRKPTRKAGSVEVISCLLTIFAICVAVDSLLETMFGMLMVEAMIPEGSWFLCYL